MLTQITCERFAGEFREIRFHAGLNAVLGHGSRSNALGKSTFLWIIDFVFGGEGYCGPGSDIQEEIKDHTIAFTFQFEGIDYFFRRSTATPRTVMQCDSAGHLIRNLRIEEYRRFLRDSYHLDVPMTAVCDRFFRIYGKENTYEKYPYLAKLRESDDKAVDFLLQLFGKGAVLSALQSAEEELGIREVQWVKSTKQPKSFEEIEANEVKIAALRERLSRLMKGQDGAIDYLGLEAGTFENVKKLQKQLRALTKQRRQLASRLEAIQNGNQDFIRTPLTDDFAELTKFFPGANIRELSQVEDFHRQLHAILQTEIDEEVAKLNPMIAACDREIARLSERLSDSGVASDLTQRVLSQCVSTSKRIEELEEENRSLAHERELQEQRRLAEARLEALINDRVSATEEATTAINEKLAELNKLVTSGRDHAPILTIKRNKTVSFGTKGNTSEGTAFKSMVLYDLAILSLTCIPALIHDGNILHSISRDQLDAIIHLYRNAGKQVFIAVNDTESNIPEDSVVLKLSEGHELYGYSWSKNRS